MRDIPSTYAETGTRRTVWPVVAFAIIWLSAIGYLSLDSVADIVAQRRASTSYLPTDAIVIDTNVSVHRPSGRAESQWTYKPIIRYRYQVAGLEYQNATYRFPGFQMSEKTAQAIIAGHPPGAHFQVFYDPNDPAKAVIDRSAPAHLSTVLLAALGFGIGLVVLFFGIRGVNASGR